MKQYNCPDCTHTENTCENCIRYILNQKTNTIETLPLQNIDPSKLLNIPDACKNCPQHSLNGDSGNCLCTLVSYEFTCLGGNG